MHQVNLQEAKILLPELIKEVESGEEVVITTNNGKAFQIVSINLVEPIPKFGSAKGLVKMSEDFDAPLPEFDEYAP